MSAIQDIATPVINVGDTATHNLLLQQIRQLANVQEQLEPLNLRCCTEEIMKNLILQLHEIAKATRYIPASVIEIYGIPKKAFLQNLRSSLIELLLAQDQLAANGRISNFYQHLLLCQEHLNNTFDSTLPKREATVQFETLQQVSSEHIQKYCTDFLAVQNALENANVLSIPESESSIEQFDSVDEVLNALNVLVQEISVYFCESPYMQKEDFGPAYQFYINISYLEEQVPRLLERIKIFHSACYSSPKRAEKISREITYNFDAIVQSSREIPPILTVLLNLPYAQKEHRNHLQLVYSSVYK